MRKKRIIDRSPVSQETIATLVYCSQQHRHHTLRGSLDIHTSAHPSSLHHLAPCIAYREACTYSTDFLSRGGLSLRAVPRGQNRLHYSIIYVVRKGQQVRYQPGGTVVSRVSVGRGYPSMHTYLKSAYRREQQKSASRHYCCQNLNTAETKQCTESHKTVKGPPPPCLAPSLRETSISVVASIISVRTYLVPARTADHLGT